MAKFEDIIILVNILKKHKKGFGLFHCTSLYPPKLRESRIKGLSFFIQFPTKIDSLKIFNEMVNDAKILSKKYKGTLCDSKHNKLNSKTLKTMRELAGSYNNEY